MIFNGKQTTPAVISTKAWLLHHSGHKKVNQVISEESGNAPDMRVVYCQDCNEIFLAGFVRESEG